jgi:hypothetical protein
MGSKISRRCYYDDEYHLLNEEVKELKMQNKKLQIHNEELIKEMNKIKDKITPDEYLNKNIMKCSC